MQDVGKGLIEAAGRGESGAFRELYDRTSGYVYTLAWRVTGRKQDAEEVTQDVFVRLHRSLGSFKFESSFKTWLYRVTMNTALNHAKKRSRVSEREIGDEDGDRAVAGPDALRAVEAGETELRLKAMLDRLNPDQRACIVLREIEGMDYQAIANALSVNLNTVRSRLKRAREALMAMGKKEVTVHAMS
jgi:RNA polymerase sigma-70 factor (ECF subfamily)